jgi:hypothetical protein
MIPVVPVRPRPGGLSPHAGTRAVPRSRTHERGFCAVHRHDSVASVRPLPWRAVPASRDSNRAVRSHGFSGFFDRMNRIDRIGMQCHASRQQGRGAAANPAWRICPVNRCCAPTVIGRHGTAMHPHGYPAYPMAGGSVMLSETGVLVLRSGSVVEGSSVADSRKDSLLPLK